MPARRALPIGPDVFVDPRIEELRDRPRLSDFISERLPPEAARARSSIQKLAWANYHLDKLKEAAELFVQKDTVGIESEFKAKRPGYDLVFSVLQLPPPDIVLRTGDVIGNLRDALDHLIWELTVAYNGSQLPGTAWPICVSPTQWPLTTVNGKKNTSSGEWKIRGIAPALWPEVKRLQPFWRKRKVSARPKHWIWILDELRNIDRHRRLAVTPVTTFDTHTTVTIRDRTIWVIQEYRRVLPPKDGSVMERYRFPPGVSESDVCVDGYVGVVTVVLDEPSAHQRRTDLIGTLDDLYGRVESVLTKFGSPAV